MESTSRTADITKNAQTKLPKKVPKAARVVEERADPVAAPATKKPKRTTTERTAAAPKSTAASAEKKPETVPPNASLNPPPKPSKGRGKVAANKAPGRIFATVCAQDACFDELKLCCDSFKLVEAQLIADCKKLETSVRNIMRRVATFEVYEAKLLEQLDEIAERHISNKRQRGM